MARDGYEQVAGIVGDEMDKAWKGIMDRLANVATGRATAATVAGLGPVPLNSGIVQEFFANLGGADLALAFV